MRSRKVFHDQSVFDVSAVRTLGELRGEPVVTSFYLDVDGRRFPRPSDIAPHVEHLFRKARKSAEQQGNHVVDAVDADLSRISDWLGRGLDRSTTRGIAAFSCDAAGVFDTFGLAVPVRDQVVVGPIPDIAQLAQIFVTAERTLVVVLDSHRSRILRLEEGVVEERDAPLDEAERQADTDVELGSFEHRHEELAREHYRRVAHTAIDELQRLPAKHIVLCGTHEAVKHLEGYLPSRAVALVSGRIRLPVSSVQAELARASREVVRDADHLRQASLVRELADRAAEGAAAVSGLSATLEALRARRVRTLLVEEGFEVDGARCPDCGELAAHGVTKCPSCASTMIFLENVVDALIARAFIQDVRIEPYERGALAGLGHIGALEGR